MHPVPPLSFLLGRLIGRQNLPNFFKPFRLTPPLHRVRVLKIEHPLCGCLCLRHMRHIHTSTSGIIRWRRGILPKVGVFSGLRTRNSVINSWLISTSECCRCRVEGIRVASDEGVVEHQVGWGNVGVYGRYVTPTIKNVGVAGWLTLIHIRLDVIAYPLRSNLSSRWLFYPRFYLLDFLTLVLLYLIPGLVPRTLCSLSLLLKAGHSPCGACVCTNLFRKSLRLWQTSYTRRN